LEARIYIKKKNLNSKEINQSTKRSSYDEFKARIEETEKSNYKLCFPNNNFYDNCMN
jgi:hypothetical protein